VPIGGGLQAAGARGAAGVVAAAAAKLVEAALGLAAPVVVAVWLTDLALAFIARAAPGIPVYFLGLPAKGLIGVGLVLLGLAGVGGALARGFPGWMALLDRLLVALRGG